MKTHYSRTIYLCMLALLNLSPLSAYASTPSYSYISFSYVTEKDNSSADFSYLNPVPVINLSNTPFSGSALVGSTEITSRWFAELRYRNLKGEKYTTSTTSAANFFSPHPSNASTGTIENDATPAVTQASGSVGYQIFQDNNSSIFLTLGLVRTTFKIDYHQQVIFRDSSGNIVTSSSWQPYNFSASQRNSGKLITIGYRSNLNDHIQFGVGYDDALFSGYSSNNYVGEFIYKFTENYSLQLATELASNSTQLSAGVRYIF